MRILYLLSSLEYGGAAKQALLLGRGLAGACELRVCALGSEGPWAAELRAAGAVVQSLDRARPIDPLALWRLRRLLRDFQPERIHVWRLPALRWLAFAGRQFLPRCIVSQALPTKTPRPRLAMVDRWLLRRVARIVADGPAAAACLERLGIGAERVAVVPSGVEVFSLSPVLRGEGRGEGAAPVQGLPSPPTPLPRVQGRGEKRIVCLGNLHAGKGFREALRAADYLAYCFPDVHLYVIGAGSFLPSLERFMEGVYHADRVHFLGARADAAAWLADADMVWVPSLAATGRQVALEAMAAGRPVIASDLPHLRETICQSVTGLLTPPGSCTTLARYGRQLLLDDALRRRLGEAGRETVRGHFSASACIEKHRALYGLEPSCPVLETASDSRFSVATAHSSRNNAVSATAVSSARSGRHGP
jgi:glycosyltransferase involved in cell wall biosynthesis